MTHQDDLFLEKVILFLIVLVAAILTFSQFQYYKISQSYWTYVSIFLIIVSVSLIAWLLMGKPASHKSSEHLLPDKPKHESKPLTLTALTLTEKATYGMTALVALIILFNQMQISQASALVGLGNGNGLAFKSSSANTPLALTGNPTQDAMAIVIPRGTPFYGEALGVSFEDPIRSLEIIAQLDPSYGRSKVQLTTQEEKARYIDILTTPTITCEYCCGVKTAVTQDGRPTCGCKHSWAMRGLTAYLIKNHPQLSDDEIKKEVIRWKGLFFPKQMIQRYVEETQTGQYTPDIAALLLDVDEKKLNEMKQSIASGEGAQGNVAASSINNLPSMVGGC